MLGEEEAGGGLNRARWGAGQDGPQDFFSGPGEHHVQRPELGTERTDGLAVKVIADQDRGGLLRFLGRESVGHHADQRIGGNGISLVLLGQGQEPAGIGRFQPAHVVDGGALLKLGPRTGRRLFRPPPFAAYSEASARYSSCSTRPLASAILG